MPGLWIDRLVPETVRIHQGSETMVVAALWAAARRGRAHGRRRRGGAGFADVGPGLQAITQHGLQAFLWHELPRKWLTDRRQAAHRRFAGAVAGAGRAGPLHGDLPWAPDRRGAAAYEGGGREGFRECRRAQERSGVELPDLPGPRLWFV
jgi:hypothetical protein